MFPKFHSSGTGLFRFSISATGDWPSPSDSTRGNKDWISKGRDDHGQVRFLRGVTAELCAKGSIQRVMVPMSGYNWKRITKFYGGVKMAS